jgi:hypothetical protein
MRAVTGIIVGGNLIQTYIRSIDRAGVIRILDHEIEEIDIQSLTFYRSQLSQAGAPEINLDDEIERGRSFVLPSGTCNFVDGTEYIPLKFRWKYTGNNRTLVKIRHVADKELPGGEKPEGKIKALIRVSKKYRETTVPLRYEILDRDGDVITGTSINFTVF